jgi:hypothetical protein
MVVIDQNENEQSELNKTSKPKKANYFDTREEEAVKLYITAETKEEKDVIYNEYLREPLNKMIESIIRRYKLYRKDMAFEDNHSDTHSFLMTKVDKFKPAKNKKAYSYFGTICKNYLMGQIQKDQKDMNRKVSYEDISVTLENRPDMVYYLEFEKLDAEKIIEIFLKDLRNHVSNKVENENELKLGHALIELFDNYGNIFIGNDNNKFNKNIVLLSLREMTNLNTKEIRIYLKKFKILYLETLKRIHNE